MFKIVKCASKVMNSDKDSNSQTEGVDSLGEQVGVVVLVAERHLECRYGSNTHFHHC